MTQKSTKKANRTPRHTSPRQIAAREAIKGAGKTAFFLTVIELPPFGAEDIPVTARPSDFAVNGRVERTPIQY